VFSPANVVFTGVGVLLSAAKDVEASHDTLADLFENVESFFKRLESYTALQPTNAMTEIIVKIMVEVLNIFAITTKEMRRGPAKKYLKKLFGKKEMEDALNRLDKLTQEEARMAVAEILRLTQIVGNKVTTAVNDVQQLVISIDDVKWNQVRMSLRNWVTPPDPSINHNIACGIQHGGTAQWFFRGGIFRDWKSTGSLLWIYGKRVLSPLVLDLLLTNVCTASGVREEHPLLSNRSRHRNHLQDRISIYCLFLFRL
jgi:hypothetical protein